MIEFYQQTKDEVLKDLNTTDQGLSKEEEIKKQQKYGFNEIKRTKKISPFKIYLNQFKSFIIWILIIAVILSIAIGEHIDAVVIGIILILNSIFGFIQEFKAEKSIESLKKMTALKAKVIRKGKEELIEAKNLVPGDIIFLEEGDKIPADARIIEESNLETQEASLTGESTSIEKNDKAIKGHKEISDQKNMLFAGTVITAGNAKAVIVKTGMETEIGKIAHMIQETEEGLTPLQQKLKVLGKVLGITTIIICLIVFLTGILKGEPAAIMFIVAVSLAVAAIPEGLPAVMTMSLSFGVQRMVKRKALIRKLPSVETLGSTTVICSDKTGTLTCNEMTVEKVFVDGEELNVTGEGYSHIGEFSKKTTNLELLLKIGSLCNNASVQHNGEGKEHDVIGDPTEAALIVSAEKIGMKKDKLNKINPRLKEIPFTSERKIMSTLNKVGNKKLVLSKGAPDVILNHCTHILKNNLTLRMTVNDRKKILDKNHEFANSALRVLGFAYKKSDKLEENGLVFVGLQAMIDPPREEVKEDIKRCKEAGIRTVMITGDHKITAEAIGREIGLEGKSMTGEELDKLTDLTIIVEEVSIYARVNPSHKIKIVEALKEKGHIVAMTGDGVNDAPALKKADIGIAMGIKGTDVAKEASDMILMDDNFNSIVNAVEEGRGIYNNVKRFVNYLLSCNLSEVLTIFLASIIGWPLPLVAIQILWMNLVTDGLPALALGADPITEGLMQQKPRNPKEHIVSKNMTLNIIVTGLLFAVVTLAIFRFNFGDLEKARTMAFSTLVLFQLARAYVVRSNYTKKIFSNKALSGAIGLSFLLQLLVIYSPLNSIFKTVPLGLIEWIIILTATIIIFFVSKVIDKLIIKVTHEHD